MQDLKLTPTSYIVLGLLDAAAPAEATPYDLKQMMAVSVDNFWSTPHAQVYREPERLAAGGYVTERREETGRRRRFYAITDRGRAALEDWRGTAPDDLPELRDPGVLKLFFGADPAVVAEHQIAAARGQARRVPGAARRRPRRDPTRPAARAGRRHRPRARR